MDTPPHFYTVRAGRTCQEVYSTVHPAAASKPALDRSIAEFLNTKRLVDEQWFMISQHVVKDVRKSRTWQWASGHIRSRSEEWKPATSYLAANLWSATHGGQIPNRLGLLFFTAFGKTGNGEVDHSSPTQAALSLRMWSILDQSHPDNSGFFEQRELHRMAAAPDPTALRTRLIEQSTAKQSEDHSVGCPEDVEADGQVKRGVACRAVQPPFPAPGYCHRNRGFLSWVWTCMQDSKGHSICPHSMLQNGHLQTYR